MHNLNMKSKLWSELSNDEKLARHIFSICGYYWAIAGLGTVAAITYAINGKSAWILWAVIALFFLVLGIALKRYSKIAWVLAMGVSVVLLPMAPLGTIGSIYSFVYLTKARKFFTKNIAGYTK